MCFLLLGASLDRLDSVTRNKYLHCGANRFSNYAAIGNALQQQPAQQVLRNHLAFVWVGSPFFCGSPVTAANIAELREQYLTKPHLLNGTFFIAIVEKDRATLISDRFGSIPVFVASLNDAGIVIATGYRSVLAQLTPSESGGLSETAVYEFIYMRRLFGTKTYHDRVSCLPSASITKINSVGKVIESVQFWKPKVTELDRGENEPARLVESLKSASRMYMRDDVERYGLMLSGGLDSRGLLSLGRSRYSTFTTAPSQNNEYKIARELARNFGAEHKFLLRNPDHLVENFSSMVLASNAMTVFHECQFMEHAETIASEVDVVHMGIGLDIMFCGHYMFKHRPSLFGRPALFFILDRIDEQHLEQIFIENVSYRLKTSDVQAIVKPGAIAHLDQALLNSAKQKLDEGRGCGLSGHRLWEYMHLTDLGRHYSTLMARSLSQYLPVEIPAFENDLYDLAFRLSVKGKVNWRVYLQALRKLSTEAMRVPNSNSNIRASLGPFAQTGINISRGVAARLFPSAPIRRMPQTADRSWSAVRNDLENEFFNSKIDQLADSSAVIDLSFIDPDKLRNIIADHKSKRADHSVLVNLLLTLEYGLLQDAVMPY